MLPLTHSVHRANESPLRCPKLRRAVMLLSPTSQAITQHGAEMLEDILVERCFHLLSLKKKKHVSCFVCISADWRDLFLLSPNTQQPPFQQLPEYLQTLTQKAEGSQGVCQAPGA